MRTVFELQFEKLVIFSISERDCTAQTRAELFREFYKNGATYYEELCDILYLLSAGEMKGILYITPAGMPYVSFKARSHEDRRVLSADELPTFSEDLYEQLYYFMQRFSNDRNFTIQKESFLTLAIQCDTISST